MGLVDFPACAALAASGHWPPVLPSAARASRLAQLAWLVDEQVPFGRQSGPARQAAAPASARCQACPPAADFLKQSFPFFAKKKREEKIYANEQVFQEEFSQQEMLDFQELKASMYSDLPEYKVVKSFESIEARDLINRYNCALVQGLLLHAHSLVVEIEESCVYVYILYMLSVIPIIIVNMYNI